jgi:membrane protein CcdC involved in cytochrome C biogenesis
MIERQERNLRRDGALFLFGIVGIIFAEVIASSRPVGSKETAVHGFLFGCSVGILLSGVFRATSKQALYSTLALGIGFAFGAVIDVL